MVLKIRDRKRMPKKVLIYGLDGSGKSTFAETFCRENNLSPICVDIDDTNFTNIPCIEFERTNHLKVKEQLVTFINDAKASDDYDTIVIDGVSSLLNLLVSNSKGISKYGDRISALNKILNELVKTKMNFILIGQIDLSSLDENSSSAVVNINSIVNEKYECHYDGKRYTQTVKKFRRLDEVVANIPQKKKPTPVPVEQRIVDPQEKVSSQNQLDSVTDIASSIVAELESKDLTSAKKEVLRLMKEGIISDDDCPKVVAELENLL